MKSKTCYIFRALILEALPDLQKLDDEVIMHVESKVRKIGS